MNEEEIQELIEEQPYLVQTLNRYQDPIIEQLQQGNQQLKIQISARETVCNEKEKIIEKAKEYINNTDTFIYNSKVHKLAEETSGKDLLDILNGEDKK